MMRVPSKAVLSVLLFLCFSAANSRAQLPSNRDADTAAIKQCVAAFADTWNSHDAHGVAMKYVEDGIFQASRVSRATAARNWKITIRPSSPLF
jgi:hypothetical protein